MPEFTNPAQQDKGGFFIMVQPALGSLNRTWQRKTSVQFVREGSSIGAGTQPFMSVKMILIQVITRMLIASSIVCVASINTARCEGGKKPSVCEAALEIIGLEKQFYSYDKLSSSKDKERITITVTNVGNKEEKLTGNIEVSDLTDMEGKKAELIFRMLEQKNGEFRDVSTAEIGIRKSKKLTFELLRSPITLKPGTYKADIKLIPVLNEKAPRTVRFYLTVDPNIEVAPVKADYDYFDLVSGEYRSFVAFTFRNPRNEAVTINPILNGQNNILSQDGKPISLVFKRIDPDENGRLFFFYTGRAVKIDAGRVVTLYFKLQRLNHQPAQGIYTAVLTTDNGAEIKPQSQLSIYVPSKEIVEAKTFLQAARVWFLQLPRHWSLTALGNKFRLDPVFWDLFCYAFLIIAALLWRRSVFYFRRHHLGTIEIEPLNATEDSKLKPELEGLEALLKGDLEELGLAPPTQQPLLSIGTEVSDIITKSGISGTGILKAGKEILVFVWGILWPPIGHKVAITFRGSSPVEAILEIKDVRSGRSEEIKKEILGESAEEVVKKVAYSIYVHARKQKHIRNRVAKWERFTDPNGKGFECYQTGKNLQEKGDLEAAIKKYKEAADLELNNAVTRLALGSALETSGRFLEAMEVYLHIVMLWPEMISPRYRLAVNFSYHEQLMNEWNDLEDGSKERLLTSLRHYLCRDASIRSEQSSLKKKEPNAKFFLALSGCQWNYLLGELRWHRCFWNWLKTFNPIKWRSDIRDYLWTFSQLWPWGVNRREYKRSSELAKYSSEIQGATRDNVVKDILQKVDKVSSVFLFTRGVDWEKVDRLSSASLFTYWRGIDWAVSYNAACAYSRALEFLSKQEGVNYKEDYEEWSKKGVGLLNRVILDPESASIRTWLLSLDPDLDHLRDCDAFHDWIHDLGVIESVS
jgi:tetratricopeptide (TPR) repeat protein